VATGPRDPGRAAHAARLTDDTGPVSQSHAAYAGQANRGYRRAGALALGAGVALLLVGALTLERGRARARPATGDARVVSAACPCRFRYPAAWFFRAAIGDTSQPPLALHSYDDANAAHLPAPTRLADIGIDWHPDPDGRLYHALIAAPPVVSLSPPEQVAHLVVSGFPALSYAHWTGLPSEGGLYEQHVYLWAPAYGRDYDLSLMAANPPGRDVARERAVFARVLRSLVIGLPARPRPRPQSHAPVLAPVAIRPPNSFGWRREIRY